MADGAVLRKVVKSKKRKYFVKWRGLSYRESTWETAKVRKYVLSCTCVTDAA